MTRKKERETELANNPMPHQRLVEDAEVRNEADVEVEIGSHDPMAEQCMVGNDPPQPDYVQQSTFCWGLCCIRGCVMGVVGMLYFFVVLPTGVLLVFHGVSKRRSLTLNLGVGILCVPTFLVILTILLLKFCHVKRKDRRTEKVAKKRTLAFENPLSRRRPGDDDVCSSMC